MAEIITEHSHHYKLVEKAIDLLRRDFKEQPTIESIAAAMNLSTDHFSEIFSKWAGVSPKKFLQFLTIAYAQKLLRQGESTTSAAFGVGLSGVGRLHDLFIQVEAMTPGEFKKGGEGLNIDFNFYDTVFGKILIASTFRGICHISFVEEDLSSQSLLKRFPSATMRHTSALIHFEALKIFCKKESANTALKLHLKGSPFQLKVWQALMNIGEGELKTYTAIANTIGKPEAIRAVGTAIGQNPIAFIIPCHRVLRSTGELGGYHWGLNRKAAMIGWEASAISKISDADNFH